jgi:cell division protein ZapA
VVSESRATTVQILGHEYRIRSEETAEFVREVAEYVDGVMKSISSQMSSGTTSQVAVLAALNIAEELFRERRDGRNGGDGSEVDERMRALMTRLHRCADSSARLRLPCGSDC